MHVTSASETLETKEWLLSTQSKLANLSIVLESTLLDRYQKPSKATSTLLLQPNISPSGRKQGQYQANTPKLSPHSSMKRLSVDMDASEKFCLTKALNSAIK